MADTYTTRNRWEKMEPGQYLDTWGTRRNNSVDLYDVSIDGVLALAVSGSVTLSTANGATDQARYRCLNLTGTGGTVTVPNVEKVYWVVNGTSGTVTFTTGSGTSAAVVSGASKWVGCTGSNVCFQSSGPDFGAMTVATTGLGSFGTLSTSGLATLASLSVTGTASFNSTGTISGAFTMSSYGRAGMLAATGADVTLAGTPCVRTYINVKGIIEAINSGTDWIDLDIRAKNLNLAGAGTTVAVAISNTGAVTFPAISTTASAANAFLNSAASNNLLRSTSSLRYKRDVETLDHEYADAVLNLRPVWYRSRCDADDPRWGYYGFIAEEAAEIDPRLVHWAYLDSDYDEIQIPAVMGMSEPVLDECGEEVEPAKEIEIAPARTDRVLRKDAKLAPDGFQYERVCVLLLDVVKRLEARVAALEAV